MGNRDKRKETKGKPKKEKAPVAKLADFSTSFFTIFRLVNGNKDGMKA